MHIYNYIERYQVTAVFDRLEISFKDALLNYV